MFHVIYLSAAVVPFTRQELEILLVKARKKNEERGITGILCYRDGNFLQVIEGEETAVRRLLSEIESDPRHRRIITLFQETIPEREFSEWSMAFRDLESDPDLAPEGFNDILNRDKADMDLAAYSLKVRTFLAKFSNS